LGTTPEEGRRLRAEGWVTVDGLAAVDDQATEARRLGCGHLLRDGEITELEE
jgi:ATP phosphoribosyltransferase regulatory subunit